MPEFIDPVFAKTSPKHSFSVIENERFGRVFAKTVSIKVINVYWVYSVFLLASCCNKSFVLFTNNEQSDRERVTDQFRPSIKPAARYNTILSKNFIVAVTDALHSVKSAYVCHLIEVTHFQVWNIKDDICSSRHIYTFLYLQHTSLAKSRE